MSLPTAVELVLELVEAEGLKKDFRGGVRLSGVEGDWTREVRKALASLEKGWAGLPKWPLSGASTPAMRTEMVSRTSLVRPSEDLDLLVLGGQG